MDFFNPDSQATIYVSMSIQGQKYIRASRERSMSELMKPWRKGEGKKGEREEFGKLAKFDNAYHYCGLQDAP